MIRALVDFSLKNRWLILGGVVVLTRVGRRLLPQSPH